MLMTTLDLARQVLLEPAGLNESQLENILGDIVGYEVDRADLYFQSVRSESWRLEDGIVKEGLHDIRRGVGARAISGEKTGFAYSDDIVLTALMEATMAARSIAQHGKNAITRVWHPVSGHALYPIQDPLDSLPVTDKIALLHRV